MSNTSVIKGPCGEPGPCCYPTELQMVRGVTAELEGSIDWEHPIRKEDGFNHCVTVDAYALRQAVNALHNYATLLSQPLHELVSPYFYHSQHCIRRTEE